MALTSLARAACLVRPPVRFVSLNGRNQCLDLVKHDSQETIHLYWACDHSEWTRQQILPLQCPGRECSWCQEFCRDRALARFSIACSRNASDILVPDKIEWQQFLFHRQGCSTPVLSMQHNSRERHSVAKVEWSVSDVLSRSQRYQWIVKSSPATSISMYRAPTDPDLPFALFVLDWPELPPSAKGTLLATLVIVDVAYDSCPLQILHVPFPSEEDEPRVVYQDIPTWQHIPIFVCILLWVLNWVIFCEIWIHGPLQAHCRCRTKGRAAKQSTCSEGCLGFHYALTIVLFALSIAELAPRNLLLITMLVGCSMALFQRTVFHCVKCLCRRRQYRFPTQIQVRRLRQLLWGNGLLCALAIAIQRNVTLAP